MKASFKKVYGPPWDYARLERWAVEPITYQGLIPALRTLTLISQIVEVEVGTIISCRSTSQIGSESDLKKIDPTFGCKMKEPTKRQLREEMERKRGLICKR